MSTTKVEDLPPEIRDQKDLIDDGLTDEIDALEDLADEQERLNAPGGLPRRQPDQAEPTPETL